jgi:Fur family ferric uptake transcriptional regulator
MSSVVARANRRSAAGAPAPVQPAATGDADLRAALKAAGLRVTGPRLAVLEELARTTEPVSHAELVERLTPRGLDRVTVWRNLTTLVEAGILARTDLGDRTWRFERATGVDHVGGAHPHFVCIDCKKVSCLPEDAVYLKSGAARGSVVLEVHVKGRCDDCV